MPVNTQKPKSPYQVAMSKKGPDGTPPHHNADYAREMRRKMWAKTFGIDIYKPHQTA